MIFIKEKSNFYNYSSYSLETLEYVDKQKEENKTIKNISTQK